MSDQQKSEIRRGRLARALARLRQARRRRQAGRLSTEEAAQRAADDLEGVHRRDR
ncbi:hypothetical protein [Streptomyces fulvoviolaceus]|uniref:hypothetical protein n=1 Tax=Streptomyces fulvoviolaceus TaxID=285535 RepID=UPI0021C24F59|nr:hypothetical protein [Streptomyces fulvoviolaceus]MCT9084458.1 hypothetical protein [Streptomyces fulvoviolaceus]